MEGLLAGSRHAAGWLLIAGGMLAIVGAFWPPYAQWSSPLEPSLRIIHAHPIGWRCIHAGFASGTVVSTLGLALLAYALRGRTGGGHALLVAVLWSTGAVFWIANIAIRLGVTPWAAAELVRAGSLPGGYAAWRAFERLLFAAFAVLAYASVAGLGWTVLRGALAPAWTGWLLVAWGATGGFVVGANVPFVAYVPLVIVGGFLVRGG